MIFFTDITTNISNYCMLNIKKYNDNNKNNKKIIFIDPSVYELKNHAEYSRIDILHKLVKNLKKNEYITIDYPCDMNAYYTGLFIEKSYYNNILYSNIDNYICVIQFEFMNYQDFVFQFNRLKKIWENNDKKIIGIGNMCRMLLSAKSHYDSAILNKNNDLKIISDLENKNLTDKEQKKLQKSLNRIKKLHEIEFCINVFDYIKKNVKNKCVHIYGASLTLIKYFVSDLELNNIFVSVDSTKWTKRVHTRIPLDKAICCRKNTRDIFFLEYINEIKKNNIDVIY